MIFAKPLTILFSLLVAWPGIAEAAHDHEFAKGQKEFQQLSEKKGATPTCSNSDKWMKLYCINGFYYSLHEHFLRSKTGNMLAALPEHTRVHKPSDRIMQSMFYFTLGMYYSFSRSHPKSFIEDFKGANLLSKQNFIDGWGFAQYKQFGYEDAKNQCRLIKDPKILNSCFWGLGRGFYFSKFPAGRRTRFNPNFVSGYLFSKNYNQKTRMEVSAIPSMKRPDIRSSEVMKNYFFNRGETKGSYGKFFNCLESKHMHECTTSI